MQPQTRSTDSNGLGIGGTALNAEDRRLNSESNPKSEVRSLKPKAFPFQWCAARIPSGRINLRFRASGFFRISAFGFQSPGFALNSREPPLEWSNEFCTVDSGLEPGLFLLSAGIAAAQVDVAVVLDHEQYLQDESLPVEVRIANRSGQDLHLGQEGWLTFSIERKDGFFVRQLGKVPVKGKFTLESSYEVKRRLDLMPYFSLSEPGRYYVTAMVKLKQWGQEIGSKPKSFDITRGARIWQQEFGVPTTEGIPETRRYALIQANNFKRLMLYLRLTDPLDQKVFRMLALGQLVSFSRPEAQVDKESNLHVLFQTGARAFLYYRISPQGTVLLRQTHEYGATRPVLKNNEEGKIFVSGGVRRINSFDIPPPPKAVVPEQPTTPATQSPRLP